jgi:hypothetical protein
MGPRIATCWPGCVVTSARETRPRGYDFTSKSKLSGPLAPQEGGTDVTTPSATAERAIGV